MNAPPSSRPSCCLLGFAGAISTARAAQAHLTNGGRPYVASAVQAMLQAQTSRSFCRSFHGHGHGFTWIIFSDVSVGGATAVALRLIGYAQQSATPVIGFCTPVRRTANGPQIDRKPS
jgi:hypothetical protein